MRISSNATSTYNNFFCSNRNNSFNLIQDEQENLNEAKTDKEPTRKSSKKSESSSKIITNPDGSKVLFIKTTTSQGATFCQNIKLSDTETFSDNKDNSNNTYENTNSEADNNTSEINSI